MLLSTAAALTHDCLLPNGTRAPCGPGIERCGAPLMEATGFHLSDPTCLMNDPNGLVYDAVHGVYHVFFQDHLALAPGVGPVYGHFVSRDLAHWAQLPVAIWNDQPYDSVAVYTGSATVVNGQVVQVYPGVCSRNDPALWPDCQTGTNLNLAVPADPTDPLLTHWRKPPGNPVVNDTQRDPSSAWQTASGEWRMTTYDAVLYASRDFKEWRRVGIQPGWLVGECPSLFPLPRPTPGAGAAPPGAKSPPTHVHKYSNSWLDFMRLGTYTDGAPGEVGNWTPWDQAAAHIDGGAFYASKDLWDPNGGRRIIWGWTAYAGPGQGVLSLPREVTWHPELQQLVFSPLPEQDMLRGSVLTELGRMPLSAGGVLPLAVPAGNGSQAEVDVTFALPDGNASFGVSVMGGADPAASGMLYFVHFWRGGTAGVPHSIQVGSVNLSISSQYATWSERRRLDPWWSHAICIG